MLSTLNSRLGNAFSELNGVSRDMDRLFERMTQGSKVSTTVPVALWGNDEHVYLELDVPGFAQDEIEMTFKEGRLWIRGQRKAPQYEGQCWHDERTYGQFERVISLSELIDPESVNAELENGVLHVTLTKRPEARPQRITINSRQSETRRLDTTTETPAAE